MSASPVSSSSPHLSRATPLAGRDRALGPPLAQVAFSVVDLAATERWFREGLGFRPAGGSRRRMRGPLASSVQGLPRAASTCWWMVDRNEFFQLELFQFERPLARLMAHDFRPCDIGNTRIGVWVADFDQALTRLGRLGSPPLSDPMGSAGARRVCVRNPDGVYVEIMEDDPLSGTGFAPSRSACPSLRARSRFQSRTSRGPKPSSPADSACSVLVPRCASLSTRRCGGWPAHRRAAACHRRQRPRRARAVPRSGRAAAPAGYRISDQGILNIAFGARSRRDHGKLYRRARAAGGRENCRPIHMPGAGGVYVNDRTGSR